MHRAKTPQSPYLFPACRSPRSTGFRQPWCEKKEEPEEGSGRRWRCGRQGGVGRFRRGRIPARERPLVEGGQSHAWPAAAAAADGPRPGGAEELEAEQSTAGGGDGATAGDPRQGGAARKGCRAAQGADLEPPGRNPPAAEKMGAEACADPPGGAGEGRPADEEPYKRSVATGRSSMTADQIDLPPDFGGWRGPRWRSWTTSPGARYEAVDGARWRRAVGNDLWRMKNRGARGCGRVRV